jgi:hypothetical protein
MHITLDGEAVQWKSWMDKKNLYSSLTRFKRYSLFGLFRYLRLKMRGREVVRGGRCLLCGRCCQRISLEAGGRWLRRETDFKRVVKRNPEYSRFIPVGRDGQGFLLFSCSWYQPEGGICGGYEKRLPICSNFPDIELYLTGGDLPSGCGYNFEEIVPFSSILKKELEAEQRKKTPHTDT